MGLWVTPDVPVAARAKLRETALKVMAQPGIRQKFQEPGMDVVDSPTSDQLARSLRAASERQAAKLATIGFKPE